ncbi:hypothetical protein L1887_52908 [Cichorium endivia]|nr:hypothetical protein L1887_52908 [Cichorium endivia]
MIRARCCSSHNEIHHFRDDVAAVVVRTDELVTVRRRPAHGLQLLAGRIELVQPVGGQIPEHQLATIVADQQAVRIERMLEDLLGGAQQARLGGDTVRAAFFIVLQIDHKVLETFHQNEFAAVQVGGGDFGKLQLHDRDQVTHTLLAFEALTVHAQSDNPLAIGGEWPNLDDAVNNQKKEEVEILNAVVANQNLAKRPNVQANETKMDGKPNVHISSPSVAVSFAIVIHNSSSTLVQNGILSSRMRPFALSVQLSNR